MTNFVPHDEYQNSLNQQVRRIKKTYLERMAAKIGQLHRNLRLLAQLLGLLMLVLLGLGVAWLLGVDLTFLEISDERGKWIPLLSAIFVVPMLLISYRALNMTEGEKWRRAYGKEIDLRCPHCASRIELSPPYDCGFCGFTDELGANNQLSGENGLALAQCNECGKEPIALMCPACNNDIVLDLGAYNNAKQLDYGYEGTVTGLRVSQIK